MGLQTARTMLREPEEPLNFQASLLAAMNDAVMAVDKNQVITFLNPAAEQLFGVEASAVLGRPLATVYELPQDQQNAERAPADRGAYTNENIYVRPDGKRIIVDSTINVLPPLSGGGSVIVIRDVSEKKEAEFALVKQSSDLLQANEDLTHFSYAVSHDLQAPLRTMVSFSQLLALKYKGGLDEQAGQFIRMIIEAGTRMSVMIRDLLELARYAGDDPPREESISLESALEAALENLGGELRATGATVKYGDLPDCGKNLSRFIPVFQNLIGNSLKYRQPETEPVITISSERVGNEWVIHVQDNGIGFKPEQAAELFGVFRRLHGSQYAGTGVGLAICKRIVERHGGRIWATASPGAGALFSFSIPVEALVIPLPFKEESRSMPRPAQFVLDTSALESTIAVGAPFDEFFQTLDLAQAMVRDLHGIILVWTKGAERLFGWSKSEAMGKRAHDLLKTQFSCPLEEIEIELLKNGEWKGQLQKFSKDGRRLWLASHWALYRDGSGRPQSVIEVNNDITALKEAEESLKKSSGQRDLAWRTGEMGVWRWDMTTGAVEWDETTERLHGMKPGSFNGTFEAFEERVHPSERDLVKQRIEEVLRQGPDYTIEYRALRSDGDYGWLRGRGKVIRENGIPARFIGVVWKEMTDATERTALAD